MLWTIDHSAKASLQDQIAACVRGGVTSGALAPGERLPAAQELAQALDVDRNTVLAAYRTLRESGLLEFRRGRGVRVVSELPTHAEIDHAVRELLVLGRRHGYDRAQIVRLIEELT